MRQFVARALSVLFLLVLCLPALLFGQNQDTKKPARSSRKIPKEITLKADEGGLVKVKTPVSRDRRTPGATGGQDQVNAKPVEAPAFRVMTRPHEDRLMRGRPFHGDLRTLPQVPPDKFERPEFEGPQVTPVPYPGTLATSTPSAAAKGANAPAPALPAPAPSASFDGLDFLNWGAGHPPDTNGDVGPTYYIQTINTSIGIFRKSDGVRVAAFTFNSFFNGHFGNLCDTQNFGDPVVLYDTFEDRWIITDFAFVLSGGAPAVPVYQCFAVSQSGDPVAGGWNFYSIKAAATAADAFDDYPKFGIWPDGLYMSANMFNISGSAFRNVRVWAFNKAQMYAGLPTVQILSFDAPSAEFTMLPSNARLQAGTPPNGTPNYFATVFNFTNAVSIYKLHADWNDISLSTFSGPFITVAPTTWASPPGSVATPPPGTNIETLAVRLMMQNQYTNIGGAESLWASHTVLGGAAGTAAPRFYQVDVSGGTVAANTTQAATHTPDTTVNRFVPSLAVDRAGDMAIGYSAASTTLKPAIRYAGRLATDPLNTLPQTETSLIEGAGTQQTAAFTRWGDYSAMTLDPDGCTFWYTTMYYQVNGVNFLTRIGAFGFPSCTPVATGTVSGTVTDSGSSNPISGATVALGSRTATTDINGNYSFTGLPSGTYPSITASFLGFASSTTTNVLVIDGNITTVNFSLTAAPASGCFVDTTQADFLAGVATNCDLITSPDNIILQSGPGIDQQNLSLANAGVGITTTTWGGQTFTPSVSGALTRVDINLFCSRCAAGPDLTLSLRATNGGLPTGADLASATIPGFISNSATYYTANFTGPPVTVTAGTRYALVIRPTANPTPLPAQTATYALTRSAADVYANGQRVSSVDSGVTWVGQTTDAGFKIFIDAGFVPSGTLVSSRKDANPAPGSTANWGTLSWVATTPPNTNVQFQIAASNDPAGPFNFVGPDGTTGTFFANGGSLAQFNSFRYLKYQATLTTTDGTVGPSLDSVSICFSNVAGVLAPSITKKFGKPSIPLNGTTSLTFNVTNNDATTPLTGLAFSDNLPAGLAVASTPNLSNSCGGTATAVGGSSSVGLSGGTLAASGSCTVSVNVQGTAPGVQNNSVQISSNEGGTGNTSTASITVVSPPVIIKAFGAASIPLNGSTSLTFTIQNNNTTTQLTGVGFTDTLPAGLVVATPNGLAGNTCGRTPTAVAGSNSISLSLVTLAAGSACSFSVNVKGTAAGLQTNITGNVTSNEGGTGGTALASLKVQAPPSIAKVFNPSTIALNATTSLVFTITNPGANVDPLTGVAFTDTLPAGVIVATPGNPSTTCSGAVTAADGSSSLSLAPSSLTPGASCTVTVTVMGTTSGTAINSVFATDPAAGQGNTATANLTVNKADTTTTVISSVNPSVFGQSVTFTATVTADAIAQPTGAVQFVVDGVSFGSPVALTGASSNSSTATSQASATLSVAGSPHSVTASYVNVDGNFNNSIGSLSGGQTITVASTATAVVSSSNPSVFGQPVSFTASVTDTSAGSTAQPTGAVQFVVDGINFGSPATLTGASSTSSVATSAATSALSIAGSPHTVTASYVNTDANFSNSVNGLTGGQVVNNANTTTTVSPSSGTITLGDTVTFTATVAVDPPGTGTPTGLVTFFDGGTPIGSAPLNQGSPDQATFPTSLLAVGSHSITAIYQGDADFTASPLSSPTTVTVNLRGSTTSLALNPTTVGAGQASTATLTVTDAGTSTPPGTPDVFSATGAPATGRTGFTTTLIADGAVVITGGTDANNNVLKSAEVYAGGAFSPTPGNLNTARTGAVAVLLANAKVLITGGSSDGTANGALNSAELLDLKTGTFTPTGQNMAAARFGTTATLLGNGKVLIAGGVNSGGVLNSAELYDPASDTFTASGNLNIARTGASATLLGTGKVMVAGGSSNGAPSGALDSAELFDPAGNGGAGTFTSVAGANPILATGRWQPEATLLLSGKVLVAGGQNSGGVLTTADLYDPTADSFTPSAHQMNEARANGSAVALPSGMVLLAGGTTSQNVDLYDADNDKFNSTGSLLHFDNGSVATLLNNGQVLVVGLPSNLETSPPPSDAELYSPSFNPLGTVGFSSSEPTDVFGLACVLTPSSGTASTCTSTVTPIQVATSPHTITGTYPSDAVHSGSSNSASLTVIPTAPPIIAKAFSADNVGQNSTVNVSFTIVNPNPAATLTGISFTDSLPAGLVVATPNTLNSNCGGTASAAAGSSSISLTGGTVGPAGPPPQLPRKGQTAPSSPIASGQCVISLDLLVTGTGTLSNTTGPISADESGPGNPSNTATLQVVLAPTVNKAFGAATIPLNGTTSLTFSIANPNTSFALAGVALSDTLPSGLVVANPNGLTGSCVASSVISATPGGGSVNMSSLNLPASGSCSYSVNVTGASAGAKTNTTGNISGTFDDGSGTFRVVNGGTASASFSVVAPPVIAKAFAPPVIAPNGISVLTFTITNPEVNTVAESGVAFTDTLPANLVVATPSGLANTCGGTATATAGSASISLTGGSAATNSSCMLSVNVSSATPGTYNNTSGAVSSTNGGTGNTASASLTVATASLSIAKTHTGSFQRGQTGATYTITVSSSATAGPTAGTVTVTDTLPNVPNTLVATGLSGTGWTCTLGTLTCTRSDSLAPGASYPAITLTVNVPNNIQANVTNSATVSGGGDPKGHTANDPTHIGAPIQLTFANSSATVTRGQSANFTFTLDSSSGLAAVIFSCGGLPSGAVCSFNPPSSTQLTDTITMSITTTGPSASSVPMFRGGPTYALLLPALGLVGLVLVGKNSNKKNTKTRLRWAMALSGLVLLLALAGCGGSPHFAGTPPGTYTVTVTGASGATSGSATVTLNVQ